MRLTFGGFVLDLDQRRLFSADAEVRLQPKGFELLKALLESRPKALSKDEILAKVWPGTFVSENNLATVVRDLRVALGDDAQEPRFIRTAYGFGYSFAAAARDLDDATPDLRPSSWCLIHNHREVPLYEGSNVLGRTGHDIVVFDSPTVSRHHAAIRIDGARVTIEDLGSKNGTWIGLTPVTVPVPVNDGAQLRLGSIVAVLRLKQHAATTETSVATR